MKVLALPDKYKGYFLLFNFLADFQSSCKILIIFPRSGHVVLTLILCLRHPTLCESWETGEQLSWDIMAWCLKHWSKDKWIQVPFRTYQGLLSSLDLGNVHKPAVLAFSCSDFCAKVFNEGPNAAKPDTALKSLCTPLADYSSCPTWEHPEISDLWLKCVETQKER